MKEMKDYTPPKETGLLDEHEKPIKIDSILRLTFNKGSHAEHKGYFSVCWFMGGFMIQNLQTLKLSFIGFISPYTIVEVMTKNEIKEEIPVNYLP